MKNLIAKASAFVLDHQKWFLLGLIILLLALPIFPMPSIVLRIIVMIRCRGQKYRKFLKME